MRARMNRCAYPQCEHEPLNPAVPACDEHLCTDCRMGVSMISREQGGEPDTCMACYHIGV